ncbi:G-protein coupled receptor 157-like [Anneissia japonica]|uniref:G-protein coupled receptor 157-like n=1 Tax=Anneissia japonica TaxID=1529436 RepID=UPI00142581CD|nr:G-protein coupled receptor 157-like [Anneissia japonica]
MDKNDTCSQPFDIHKWVPVTILISCVLSVIGSLLIICTFIIWRDLRTKARKLLVYLSITNFLASVGYAYGISNNLLKSNFFNSTECEVQSGITTFSETSSYLWTVAIATYIYASIVKSCRMVLDWLIRIFHLVCWGVPLVTVVVAVNFKVLGYDNSCTTAGWCWIHNFSPKHKFEWMMWRLIGGKFWEMAAYFVLLILYFQINKCMCYQNQVADISNQRSVSAAADRIDHKLTAIPTIFLLLNIWSTLRFILTLCHKNVSNPVLFLLHGVGDSFQGAANCIIFCFCNDIIRRRFMQSCGNLFRGPCCYERTERTQRLLAD